MGGPMRVGGKSHLPPARAGQHFSTFPVLGAFPALRLVSLRAPEPLLTSEGRGPECVDKAQSAVLRC